jgi:NarL family two-component system response regulator LiaR
MKQIRVLVVDDQPLVREGLASIISSQSDLKVVGQAQDGLEAVAIARQEKPDVILLDLAMPRQDGLTSISKLREVAPTGKILILTGYADPEKVYVAIQAGAIGYMLKDFTYDQLLQAIRDVARGQSYIDSSIAMKMIQNINPVTGQVPINHALTLTDRENQTLRLIAKGLSNQEIADALFVDKRTVAKYVSSILNKLQLANRTQAALYAVHKGLDK